MRIFGSALLAIMMVAGLVSCSGKNPVAAALDDLNIAQWLLRAAPTGDGSVVAANQLVGFDANFVFHGDNPGMNAQIWFMFEDGTSYQNKTLVYGPFSGDWAELEVRFLVSDGLLDAAQRRPGQAILATVRFVSAQNSTLRDWQFPQIRFYVR